MAIWKDVPRGHRDAPPTVSYQLMLTRAMMAPNQLAKTRLHRILEELMSERRKVSYDK